MDVTLIHNPAAGAGKPTRDELIELLRLHGYRATYASTKQRDWQAALHHPGEMVVAAGGDGTVAKVAKKMAGRSVPVALLPLGTANNIATSLGAATNPDAQVAGWRTAQPKVFDFGLLIDGGGRTMPFLESIGCGVFADVLRSSEQSDAEEARPDVVQRSDRLTDARAMFRKALRAARPRHVRIMLDGVDHSGEYLLVEVMNIPCIGPRLRLAPEADPSDGRLDVVLAGEEHREMIEALVEREVTSLSAALRVRRAQEVTIEPSGHTTHYDDEPCERADDGSDVLRASVQRGPINFVTSVSQT